MSYWLQKRQRQTKKIELAITQVEAKRNQNVEKANLLRYIKKN